MIGDGNAKDWLCALSISEVDELIKEASETAERATHMFANRDLIERLSDALLDMNLSRERRGGPKSLDPSLP